VTATSGTLSHTASTTLTVAAPALTITSTHSGTFTQGQSNASYTLTVTNGASTGATTGAVAVTETAPFGLIPVSMQGAGWTCTGPTCVRSDALAPGSSYPAIALTVDVANNAPASVTNAPTVSGGGSVNANASDVTAIDALPRYSNPLAFATKASVVAGVPTTFTVTYASQAGSADIASGQVQIDSCYLGWDSSGNIALYGGPSGTLGQNATLQGFSCSINLANSSLSPVPGNPDELTLSLAITFPEQGNGTDLFGAHEVYARGTNAEALETAAVDLGAMVVSPGQDYTLTVSPSGTTTVPYLGTVPLTVTATGINGFTGEINLLVGLPLGTTNPCFTAGGAFYITANSQVTIAMTNNCPYGGPATQFLITGNAPSIGVSRAGSSSPTLVPAAGGNFTITPGMPTPSNLPAQGSISYQVTVTSIGGQAGYVNLTLAPQAGSSMPAGVTYQFAPARVYFAGGQTAQSTLTLYSTSGTPGGTYPLAITGTLEATGAQRTAVFALGTQVTGFQVTSATGSAIVHNTGQEAQVTHSVPAGNAPSYTTCDTADPDVTCRVISTSAGAVTVGVTASTSAAHGTRVLRLNGGAGTVHAAIADWAPLGVSVFPSEITEGIPREATVTVEGMDVSFEIDSDEVYFPAVVVTGPALYPVRWFDEGWNSNSDLGEFYAPLGAGGNTCSVSVDLCSYSFNPDLGPCLSGAATLTVRSAAPPPTQQPAVQVAPGPTTILAFKSSGLSTVTPEEDSGCVPIQANGQPEGGAFSWSTSSQSVTLQNAGTATVTVCAVDGAYSHTQGDVAVNVKYTVDNVPSPTATTTLTISKPTVLLPPGTNTFDPGGHTCIAGAGVSTAARSYCSGDPDGTTYTSYLRHREYPVQDQLQQTIPFNMALNESYTPSPANAIIGSGFGNQAKDDFYYCSPACRQGGGDSVTAAQTIYANNFAISTKSVTWTCTGVTVQD
jgi:hypothetical protein